jgi:hypothetical protein
MQIKAEGAMEDQAASKMAEGTEVKVVEATVGEATVGEAKVGELELLGAPVTQGR